MTPEDKVKNNVKKELKNIPAVRLFVNPSGRLPNGRGGFISFGLGGHKGSSDYIGWESITITEEMVGQKFARFASVECKAPGKLTETTPEQELWLDLVVSAGGMGTVIDDASKLKDKFYNV